MCYTVHVVREIRSLRSVPCQIPNLLICGPGIMQLLKAWIIRFDYRDNRIQARAFLERGSDSQSSNSEEASTLRYTSILGMYSTLFLVQSIVHIRALLMTMLYRLELPPPIS